MSDPVSGGGCDDVGVVGPDDEADRVVEAVERAGGRARTGDPEAVGARVDVLVAVGESSLLEAVRTGAPVPLLPVGAGRGVRSVRLEDVNAAVRSLVTGGWTPVEFPLIGVSLPSGFASALMDLALLPSEPARISEYTVSTAGGDRIARFRADGVVVATPAGSRGYARAAGGPCIAPGVDVVAVVPVAPFATGMDHWVLPAGDVALTVERDEVPVDVLADDRTAGQAPTAEPLRIERGGTVTVATVPASRSFTGDDSPGGLETL